MLRWAFYAKYNDDEYVYPANSGREAVQIADEAWEKLTDEPQAFFVGLFDMKGNVLADSEPKTIIYDRLHEITGNRAEKILKASGLNMATFSRTFGIPYRSLQNWIGGDREAPDYVLDMLEKIVWESAIIIGRNSFNK
jgi:DNA-binding transcriptional regulator YiaG